MKYVLRLARALFTLSAVSVAAADIPIETFFRKPEFSELRLSPNGKLLAATAPINGRMNLVVIDLTTRKAAAVTNLEANDIYSFQWINNARLMASAADMSDASGNIYLKARLAINIDGTEHRDLLRIRGYQGVLGQVGENSDDLIISAQGRVMGSPDVYRLNTKTGRMDILTFDNPGNVIRWVVDQTGVPRAAVSRVPGTGVTEVHYRTDAKSSWKKIESFKNDEEGILPLGFDHANTLYVQSSVGRDKAGIFTYDPEKRELKTLVFENRQTDPGSLIFDRVKKKLVGIHSEEFRSGAAWLDEDWKKLQSAVDEVLPKTTNWLSWASHDTSRVLVTSHSDVQPFFYRLLDTKTLQLEKLVESRDWIKPEQMSVMKRINYQARDGLNIPAYLTIPRGSSGRNLPLVVDIHGGPYVPGYRWGFAPDVQFLASRGYAVLRPNFRGTTGYGRKHFEAGFKQWGLAMQDDITDGVLWAIQEGIADKNRVCLYGGSYGGYATLMGLVKEPDMFTCGIAFVAVSDIGLLFDVTWSDTSRSEAALYSMSQRIGNPEMERERFRATSPLYQAEKIKAPILLAYGSDDVRVPLVHGQKFRAELDRFGKSYEWVVYTAEAHGFNRFENVIDFHRRVENFLQKHIGLPR